MKIYACALILSAVSIAPAVAQVPALVVGGLATSSVLHAGTQIPLRTITPLTTEGKKLKVGNRFDLETTEAISLNGQVVIPVGSRAIGEITDVRNKGMWGKSGRIGVRLISVQAGDRRLRISGSMDDKGKTGTAGVVASVALVPLVGFFVTGTSAAIPAGSGATGFLEEDVPVQFAAAAAAPLVIPTTVAPVAVPASVPAKPTAVLTPISTTPQ